MATKRNWNELPDYGAVVDEALLHGPDLSGVLAKPGQIFGPPIGRAWVETAAEHARRSARYLVIENTPGYLPEDDDPASFDTYEEAVACLNAKAAEYADDPDVDYRVEYGWASANNYAAVRVYDDSKIHDLGRTISVVDEEGS